MDSDSPKGRLRDWISNSVWFKALSIGIVVLIMLIPTMMVTQLVYERMNRKNAAAHEVAAKWGQRQNICGPILTIPLKTTQERKNEEDLVIYENLHFLPEDLKINVDLNSEVRKRGIFEVILYKSVVNISGYFDTNNIHNIEYGINNLMLQDADLTYGLSDMTGVAQRALARWNNEKISMEPGVANTDVVPIGMHARIPLVIQKDGKLKFELQLHLNGSEAIHFVPIGRTTTVDMTSSWPSPSFEGNFLPKSHDISSSGFSANWSVLDMNRSFPQYWRGAKYPVSSTFFGVNLIQTVDHYTMALRCVKYAILIICLTFLIYFFLEMINDKNIHSFQYLLIGLALSIFFLLLLSLSEYIGFNKAYLTAGVATIGLISIYSFYILSSKKLSSILTLLLIIIFGFIYVVLQLEDYALLVGSIGLFLALATTMLLSRNMDWSNLRNV